MTEPQTSARVDLDAITVHIIATTASAGVRYARTPWATTVAFVVASRELALQRHLLHRAVLAGMARAPRQ